MDRAGMELEGAAAPLPEGPDTFRRLCTILAHRGPLTAVRFSASEKFLAIASADSTASLHAVFTDSKSNPRFLGRLAVTHETGLNDISWAPSDNYLATAADDKTIRLWDVERLAPTLEWETPPCFATLAGHVSCVMSCEWARDETELLSAGFDETARLWDVRSAMCVNTFRAHAEPVSSACFAVPPYVVATGSYDGLVRLWDTRYGQVLKTIMSQREPPPVVSVAASPNGRFLLVSSLDSTVRLWDHSGAQFIRAYAGAHVCADRPCRVTFASSARGDAVLTGAEDGAAALYDLNARREATRLSHTLEVSAEEPTAGERPDASVVPCVDSARGAAVVATGGFDCAACLWAAGKRK